MKIALAGASHWHAAMHAAAALAAGASLSGVWDWNSEAAARFAAAHACPPRPSLDALLADRPDLVVAMGRADRMAPLVAALMDRRVPMVLEKPAARSAAELAPLRARAARESHFVAVPFANRLSPVWPALALVRAQNRLGRLSHAAFRILNGPPARYRRDGVGWVLDPAQSGGGALRNLGIHGIDACLALAGPADPEILHVALDDRLYGEAVEEYAAVTLRLPDGAIAHVEAGYTWPSMAPGGGYEWRIAAANAALTDHGRAASLSTLDDGALTALEPLPLASRYAAFMRVTLERLARGERPPAGIDDYARAMHVIDRIYAMGGK